MSTQAGVPTVVAAVEGRRLLILGNEIKVKVSCSETGGTVFAFEDTILPGDEVPLHVHSREDELLTVLEGEYEIFLDGRAYKAAAGAVANFPRNVVHGFRNASNAPARALFIVTPGENFEAFFHELSSVAPKLPADMAKVAELFSRYGLPIVAASSRTTAA